MIRFLDLNYHMHTGISDPLAVLQIQEAATFFAYPLSEYISVQMIKHMDFEGEQFVDAVHFVFFKGSNRFWYVPFRTHRYIRKQRPDIIVIQGLIFPVRLILLKLSVGRKVKIIVQHHGESPFGGIKGWLQQIAGQLVHRYVFTSLGNAREWIEKKIIGHTGLCTEILEASTRFKRVRGIPAALGHQGGIPSFLWVGRLNEGKDPMTVLNAFEQYVARCPEARLYMVYQTEELLPHIKEKMRGNNTLMRSVILAGRRPHAELEAWYSAADYFISASRQEGSGYALIEAMACGCIPVVTDIPPFKKITGNGKAGFHFRVGSSEHLLDVLVHLVHADKERLSSAVSAHFRQNLDFSSIAKDWYHLCKSLLGE